MNTTPTAVRTGSGTIHAFTIGLTYTFRGDRMTNVATSTSGKADCGALTSAAARFTAEAINCTKCATSA